MSILDKLFGVNAVDPNINALIDTNHRLTVAHTDMLINYRDQVADLKHRVEFLESMIKELKDGKRA